MVISNTNIMVDTVDVTFKLNMTNVTDPFTTPELNGTFNSWCGNCNPMSSPLQNDIWEVTLPLLVEILLNINFQLMTGQFKRLMIQQEIAQMEIQTLQIDY